MNPLAPYMAAIKVGALVAVVVALGLFGWRVHAWHEGYKELAAERACEPATECAKRAARFAEAQQKAAQAASQKAQEAVTSYEQEIASLRARPARVVRLCPDSGGVRDAAPAAGADGPSAGPGVVPTTAGRDIGADLYQLAKDADEVAARLRALQQWAKPAK